MLRLLKFLTAASTGSQCHYINSKVSVVFYWSKICTVVLVISRCSCPNPWPCLTNLQWSTLLSFLWSSHGIWWLLCRFQVCFCGHIHHPNWPLLPGTYDCQPDWTEDHQSPPNREKYTRTHKDAFVSIEVLHMGAVWGIISIFLLHPFLFHYNQKWLMAVSGNCLCINKNIYIPCFVKHSRRKPVLREKEKERERKKAGPFITWQASTPPVSTPAHIIRDVICPAIKSLHTVWLMIRTCAFWSTDAADPESQNTQKDTITFVFRSKCQSLNFQ